MRKSATTIYAIRRELLVMSGIIVLHFVLFLPNPLPRNYFNSSEEVVRTLKSNITDFNIWFENQPVGIQESPSYLHSLEQVNDFSTIKFPPQGRQERNIGINGIFISKPPVFKESYARINVDIYNYVYVSPTLTEQSLAKEISYFLKPYYQGDGIWLVTSNFLTMQLFLYQIATLIYYGIFIFLWIVLLFKYKHLQ